MRIAFFADIHANVTALQAVLTDLEHQIPVDAYVLLGDLVNYGPRPNETIEIIRALPKDKVLVNLWGNHEYSVFGGSLDRFATDRGRSVLQFTNSILTKESNDYLDRELDHSGTCIKEIEKSLVLFMHGSIDDPLWGRFSVDSLNDNRFARFDYVVSAHSHVPHYVEYFFASDNPEYRNRKRTVFINPGSVGQPRNHNPYAQYGILDTQTQNYEHRSVRYDVDKEQALFDPHVDSFYKERLKKGI